jgi:NitT/TauT family transport system ATP-binding protein
MPQLEIVEVSKVYTLPRNGQALPALGSINLAVEDGEFVSLLGPSGCGKSSLLRIIAGLEPASSGVARFAGEPIEGPSSRRGMVFQEYALPPWKTVRENVELGLKFRGVPRAERRQIAARYVALVGLTGFEDRYPHELSGGMRQRCALARTLANDAELLLMDEPFAALDATTREIIQGELLRIWGEHLPRGERKTVLFVTHSIDEAIFLSDRVAVMSRRPGVVKEVHVNTLPRPRTEALRSSPDFLKARDHLWSLVRDEALRAMAERVD